MELSLKKNRGRNHILNLKKNQTSVSMATCVLHEWVIFRQTEDGGGGDALWSGAPWHVFYSFRPVHALFTPSSDLTVGEPLPSLTPTTQTPLPLSLSWSSLTALIILSSVFLNALFIHLLNLTTFNLGHLYPSSWQTYEQKLELIFRKLRLKHSSWTNKSSSSPCLQPGNFYQKAPPYQVSF